jgi:hypothetical protein
MSYSEWVSPYKLYQRKGAWQNGRCVLITKNLTRKQRKITSRYPSSMRCWNGLQSILSFVFLIGILVITKSRSIMMTKVKLLLLVPMELMLIVGCPSDCATLQLYSKGAWYLFFDTIEEIMEVFMDDFLFMEKLSMIV